MEIRFIKAKSILNRSKINGYTINPYVGCFHGCVYCYNQHFIKAIGREEKWGSFLEIKLNAPEILEKEINQKFRNKKNKVFFSTITDPYNPLEKQYQLTRKCLEILASSQWSVSILTKSDLILRDLDIFKKFHSRIEIGFTITTLDKRAQMILEPGASLVEKRIEALRKLKKAGIRTYAFIGPVLPFFTNLKQIFRVLKDKVMEIWFDTLNTKKENWQGLEKTLKLYYPRFFPQYKKIFFFNRKEYEVNLRKEIEFLAEYFKIPVQILF
ncbi:MAG: radical SAM protein [Patescibacteria group bacterium]